MTAPPKAAPTFFAKVDRKHRVVIPKSAVEALAIAHGDRVLVTVRKDTGGG